MFTLRLPIHLPSPRALLEAAAWSAAVALLVMALGDSGVRLVCGPDQLTCRPMSPLQHAGINAIGLAGFVAIVAGPGRWLGLRPLAGICPAASTTRGPGPYAFSPRELLWFCLILGLLPAIGDLANYLRFGGQPVWSPWREFLIDGVLTGCFEEYALRGPLYERLVPFGRIVTVLATSIGFALMHLNLVWLGNKHLVDMPLLLPGYLFSGLIWGWWRWRTRTIVPVVLAHAAFDFLISLAPSN